MSFALELISQQSVIVRVGKSLIFSNADAFKQACFDEIRDGARNFILDFSETGILDSTGLSAIFSLYRRVVPLKGAVAFASVSHPVQIVIQVTGIHRVFQRYSSVEAAREAPSVRQNARPKPAATSTTTRTVG